MINLDKISTLPPQDLDKEEIKKETDKLLKELSELQNVFYADGKHSILIVLQGVDASGKDGVVREVFTGMNPMGVKVKAYKAPTEEERSYDFLWRIHRDVPQKGMIQIFNRSHYEDVLVPRVEKWINMDRIKKRYAMINAFENLLTEENNTTILKFYLHLSPEKQLEKLQERVENPLKNWKHDPNDMKVNNKWDDYRKAYHDIFKYCSDVPWHIVPVDKNWYKEYYVAKVLVSTMKKMNLQYPRLKD